MKTVNALLIGLACTLAACSEDKPPPLDQPRTPAQKTVFDTQIKSLQKAKDVQKIVDQQQQNADQREQDTEGH